MTDASPRGAILGIDPTSRGLAFTFFEDGRLLDWGTRGGGDGITLLERLLDSCPADVLVAEDPDAPRCERRRRVRQLLRSVVHHARARGLGVILVPRIEVRRRWALRGATRKHAVAAAIAEDFPELLPIVPRLRKIYRSEAPQTEVFDAASLVLYAASRT